MKGTPNFVSSPFCRSGGSAQDLSQVGVVLELGGSCSLRCRRASLETRSACGVCRGTTLRLRGAAVESDSVEQQYIVSTCYNNTSKEEISRIGCKSRKCIRVYFCQFINEPTVSTHANVAKRGVVAAARTGEREGEGTETTHHHAVIPHYHPQLFSNLPLYRRLTRSCR
jgi:hypothetical protein